MKNIILTLLMLLTLSSSAAAQRPASPLWNWSDGALATSFIADEATTRQVFNRCPTCYEAGVIKNTGARMGAKIGIFAAFKLVDWRAPETRNKSRWVKLAVAAAFALVSYHNSKLK